MYTGDDGKQGTTLWAVRAGPEYHDFLNDTLRLLTIHFTIQMMLVLVAPDKHTMASPEFWTLALFLIIGSSIYWLVFRRALVFTS